MLRIFGDVPGGHGALVVDEGGFDGVEELGVEQFCELFELCSVDEITVGAVGEKIAALAVERLNLVFNTDG